MHFEEAEENIDNLTQDRGGGEFRFVIPFYIKSVLVQSANYVKDVYSGM
jgi:hypothetical protein